MTRAPLKAVPDDVRCPKCIQPIDDSGCDKCERWVSWEHGADDSAPNLCDDCWADEKPAVLKCEDCGGMHYYETMVEHHGCPNKTAAGAVINDEPIGDDA